MISTLNESVERERRIEAPDIESYETSYRGSRGYSRKRLEPYRYLGRAPKHATTIERREGAARSAGSPPRPVPVRPEGGGPRPGAWHGPRPVGRTVLGCRKAPQMRARIEPHPATEGTPAPPRAARMRAASRPTRTWGIAAHSERSERSVRDGETFPSSSSLGRPDRRLSFCASRFRSVSNRVAFRSNRPAFRRPVADRRSGRGVNLRPV